MRKNPEKIGRNRVRQEQKLAARCIKGDKSAWDEFVDAYKNLIYSSIIRTFHLVGYKNAEEIAGDIFQEVFASLLKNNYAKLRSFKWKRSCTLASWLSIIARNLTFDYIRKIFSRQEIISSLKSNASDEEISKWQQSSDSAPLENLEEAEAVGLFEKALQKLTKHELEFIELIYFRGLPAGRVAGILGKSVDAVYMYKKRLIDKLKKTVEDML